MYTLRVTFPIIIPVSYFERFQEGFPDLELSLNGSTKVTKNYLTSAEERSYNNSVSLKYKDIYPRKKDLVDSVYPVFQNIPRIYRLAEHRGGTLSLSIRPSGIAALSYSFSYFKLPEADDLKRFFREKENIMRREFLKPVSRLLCEKYRFKKVHLSKYAYDVIVGFPDEHERALSTIESLLKTRGGRYYIRGSPNTWKYYSKSLFAFISTYASSMTRNSRRNSIRKAKAEVMQGIELTLGINLLLSQGIGALPLDITRPQLLNFLHSLNPFVISGRININAPVPSLVRSVHICSAAPYHLRRKYREFLTEYIRNCERMAACLNTYNTIHSLPMYGASPALPPVPLSPSLVLKPRLLEILQILETHFKFHSKQTVDIEEEHERYYSNPSGMLISYISGILGVHSRKNDELRGWLGELVSLRLVEHTTLQRQRGRGKFKDCYNISVKSSDLREYLIKYVDNNMSRENDTPEDYFEGDGSGGS